MKYSLATAMTRLKTWNCSLEKYIIEENRKDKRIMKKRILLSTLIASVISFGMLSACGTVVETEQNSETMDESIAEKDEDIIEESIFGLQDFEGFYCMTETEEIEDYAVTNTYGYQLNGDGTGVCFGQDVVEFTWNETEIHFADSTESFVMEPGKLTVGDVAFEKITGNFIAPNPCEIDADNIENGIFYIYLDESGISEADGKVTVRTEIYTEDSYDIVDINRMAQGDVIYINGRLLPVDSVSKTDNGIIEVNGGIENMGSALRAVDESNCYVFVGMDMESSYTRQGIANLTVSDNVKLIDYHDDIYDGIEYSDKDAIMTLKEIVKEYPLTCYDGVIIVENSEIIEIDRLFRP